MTCPYSIEKGLHEIKMNVVVEMLNVFVHEIVENGLFDVLSII